MSIDTYFFKRSITTLQQAHTLLLKADPESIEYDMYRSACVKEFEIILEQAGKLLRKCLKPYYHSPKAVDRLVFKELFRQAAQHDLLSLEEVERWLAYRDNHNSTAHDYGVKFAEKTLILLAQFALDASHLEEVVRRHGED